MPVSNEELKSLLMRVKEESEKPDLKLNIKKTMNLPCEWRTSASSYTMTPTATPTTCIGNTRTWPPPVPSPSATETWVPGTEPGPIQSRSSKWRRSQPANAANQWPSSSTIPRSSSHCPSGSSVTSTSHASPPRGQTPSFRCRPSVPGSAQIKLSGEKINKKTMIMPSSPITLYQIDGEKVETVTDFSFLVSKISADCECNNEIKRSLLLGWNAVTNLDFILNSRDITLLTKFCIVKTMAFPLVVYRCENWTTKKAENWWIDAFKLQC